MGCQHTGFDVASYVYERVRWKKKTNLYSWPTFKEYVCMKKQPIDIEKADDVVLKLARWWGRNWHTCIAS